MKNKKFKLLTSVLAPSLSLLCIATMVTSCAHNQDDPVNPEVGDYKIQFNAGTGHFKSGEHDHVMVDVGTKFGDVASPVVEKEGKTFAGWAIDTQKSTFMTDNTIICQNMTLTALYDDEIAGDVVYVTFKAKEGETGVSFSGNTTVAVKKHKKFFMINRPLPTKINEEGNKDYFKEWRLEGGTTPIAENYEFTNENTVIEPSFSEAVTITYNIESWQQIVHGQNSTVVETGSAWSSINAPEVVVSDPSHPEIFAGWSLKSDPTERKDNLLSASDTFTESTTVYSVFLPVSDLYNQHTFIVDGGSYQYIGNTTVYAYNDREWQFFNPPTPVQSNMKLDHWEYRIHGTTDSWTTPEPTTKFTQPCDFRAVMTSALDEVVIYGENKVEMQKNYEYKAYFLGSVAQDAYTPVWSLKNVSPAGVATIDASTGVVSVGKTQETNPHFTVVCTVDDGTTTGKLDEINVTIGNPLVNSNKAWTYTAEDGWRWYEMSDLCSTNQIVPHKIDGTFEASIARENFNPQTPILFGDKVTSIPDTFLINCSTFNSGIDLQNSHVESIGSAFMDSCTAFNQPLDVEGIKSIGSEFLSGCTSFDQQLSFTNENFTTIPSDFMTNATSFGASEGSTLTITHVEKIDEYFLFNCSSFNQDLIIPSSVTHIGRYFMVGVDSFASTLDIEFSGMSAMEFDKSNLTGTSDTAAIWTTGCTIAGGIKETFKAQYPDNFQDTDMGLYRRYKA